MLREDPEMNGKTDMGLDQTHVRPTPVGLAPEQHCLLG